MGTIEQILDPMPIPRMVRVKQTFERPRIENVAKTLESRIRAHPALTAIWPGMSIAVGVGSRGITELPLLVRTTVDALKAAGAMPFIIPAMGSHGGATAEGQIAMLAGLGVSEKTMGVPVCATMDTVCLGESVNGLPVYFDALAHEADGIVIINRIKPHVAFRGEFESGLMKMITIGLGKQKGAAICHELGFGKMAENIPAIGRVSLSKENVLFAVGTLENPYHEICEITVLGKNEIERKEPELLERAKTLLPRIYFDELDVLIIDEIGKNISGTGMDTNVVGRYHTPYCYGGPTITKMTVLDLTDVSHGNGTGIGIVDFTTKRVQDKFVPDQAYANCLTSTVVQSAKMPMVLANDRLAIQAAVKTSNVLDKRKVRMMHLRNTLDMELVEVSENLLPDVKNHPMMEAVSEPYSWRFDEAGVLLDTLI